LFRERIEYSRRELCVKKKNIPYLVAGCVTENEEKPMTRELGSDQGWGRRKSLKGRFRANGYAKRKPDQSRLRADQQSQFTSGICEKSSSSRAGNWEENASEEKRGSGRECALGPALA